MSVRIADENLPGAVRPGFAGPKIGLGLAQMFFPRIKVVNLQRKMIAAIVGDDGIGTFADDVKLLIGAEPKPGARKSKGRPLNRLQPEYICVESATGFDILDVNGDVIEFENFHSAFS